ncbi:cell wall hydrolase [Thalassospira sp. TSL5-1]|uniref:cell wall hydrolase n=1 Tax=Thalassospira sp. TSL5-1 TaxID=1544451 RepID=UPI00093FEE38|nr:cell wall hydrolase [Thalassospira sp. TSL5-1]OKH89136.1 hydrolase [Thalassospira sp. TSL5-1]
MSPYVKQKDETVAALADLQPVDILARTLYGEARGEELAGIEAVAAVIVNRVAFAKARGGYWWGNDIVSVCLKKGQFSCWNAGDPNREKLLRVNDRDPAFRLCRRVARRALEGRLPDLVQGATHYHTAQSDPWWARGHVPLCDIGNHVFYAGIG